MYVLYYDKVVINL